MKQQLSQPISDPLIVIQTLLDRNSTRQRLFQRDLIRNQRKHSRLLGKTTTALRKLKDLDKVKNDQDNRKQLFTPEMIGEQPKPWTLRTTVKKEDLPPLPRRPYYPTKDAIPTRRYSNNDYFEETCLSPIGKRTVLNNNNATPPLPEGWIECVIEPTDMIDVPEAAVLEPQFQTTVDEGRVYYWKESTGEVSFCPPPGSSKLANEAFQHYGRIWVQ